MDARFYCEYEPVLDTGQAKAAAYPLSIRLPFQRVYFIFYSTFGSQPQISTTQHGEAAWIIGRPAQVSAILSSERAKDIPKLRDENGSRAHI
jgi:hypothetical protein